MKSHVFLSFQKEEKEIPELKELKLKLSIEDIVKAAKVEGKRSIASLLNY